MYAPAMLDSTFVTNRIYLVSCIATCVYLVNGADARVAPERNVSPCAWQSSTESTAGSHALLVDYYLPGVSIPYSSTVQLLAQD